MQERDSGSVKGLRVLRQKAGKRIFRICSENPLFSCTELHSLFLVAGLQMHRLCIEKCRGEVSPGMAAKMPKTGNGGIADTIYFRGTPHAAKVQNIKRYRHFMKQVLLYGIRHG